MGGSVSRLEAYLPLAPLILAGLVWAIVWWVVRHQSLLTAREL